MPPKCKLECMAQYTLCGTIMSMQSVNLANSPRDALLLSFSDAKLSIVEYDSESHDLRTLSLHYFEEDDMKVSDGAHLSTQFISSFLFYKVECMSQGLIFVEQESNEQLRLLRFTLTLFD